LFNERKGDQARSRLHATFVKVFIEVCDHYTTQVQVYLVHSGCTILCARAHNFALREGPEETRTPISRLTVEVTKNCAATLIEYMRSRKFSALPIELQDQLRWRSDSNGLTFPMGFETLSRP